MVDKQTVIKAIIGDSYTQKFSQATAYAPANIALIKYWGKRNIALNCPTNDSLSIDLGNKGAETTIEIIDFQQDIVFLNAEKVNNESSFYLRLKAYLDLFRTSKNYKFKINTVSTVPVASGLASSASGFAAVILALDKLFNWQLEIRELSILARLGSGSAARSIRPGFMHWHKGEREDGMDSYAESIDISWPELCIGLLLNSTHEKNISSTKGMLHTQKTSPMYELWPKTAKNDLLKLKTALFAKDFIAFGECAENNALLMHSLMLSARPRINYSNAATIAAWEKIKLARNNGINVYATQDAGPHLKLLFLEKDKAKIKELFDCEVVKR